MNRFTRVLGALLTLTVLCGFVFMYISHRNDSQSKTTEPVLPNAPDFSLPDASGAIFSLEDLEGKVRVLTFWASWSPYSREELISLSRLKKDYGGRVSVAALNRDADSREGRAFLTSLGLSEELLFIYDQNDGYFKEVGGYAMPETLFMDTEGRIVAHQHGPMTYEEMRAQIETMLH